MYKIQFRKIIYLPSLILLLMFVVSCKSSDNSPVEPESYSRGEISSATWLGKFNKSFIKSTIAGMNVNVEINYDVDVYKIIYKTSDGKGNIVTASGALFIPSGKDNLSLMSLQHGTQTKRTKVGSINVQESPEGFIAAGLGYYTLVPDYLGLGESQMIHPYHIAKSSAEPIIDFIRACRTEAGKLNLKLNGQVFLAGYSEGGYVTMAAHREIQQKYSGEINVTASAPMAGAYDLYMTAQTILKNKTYEEPSFLTFLIYSYLEFNDWNNIMSLRSAFKSPFAEEIPSLFDGSKTSEEINAALTDNLNDLFQYDFRNTFQSGTESLFSIQLKENSLINWVPNSPMRLYHGDADQFVPYQNSIEALNYFKTNGAADVELITIPGGNHYTAAVPSIVGAIQWFDTIRLKKYFTVKVRDSKYEESFQ